MNGPSSAPLNGPAQRGRAPDQGAYHAPHHTIALYLMENTPIPGPLPHSQAGPLVASDAF